MFSYKLSCLFFLVLIVTGMFSACTPYKLVEQIPEGTHRKRIVFRSEPTPTEIFINEKYLGTTPIKTDLWFIGDRRINVRAQPLYPSQFPQNIVLKIPKIPDKMTIFMDYNPMGEFALQQKEGAAGIADDGYGGEVEQFSLASLKDTILIKEPIPLPVIYFDYDKHYIRESEKDKLYPLVELMIKNPLFKVSIHGHADERGTPGYNKVLSTNRALAIYEFLLDNDIEEDRLRIYGHGVLTVVERDGYKLEYQNDRIVSFRLHYKEFREPSLSD